jgi:uncharacterized protein (TIGR02284 family)
MAQNEKLIEVLNDLLHINNDRIKGYEKAADETKMLDVDLQAFFLKLADDSRKYASKLTEHIMTLGGQATSDTTNMGKIYRVWMDLKAAFTGQDRQAILSSCEFGEDAAQRAYRDALSSDAEMSAETRQLITSQQSELKSAHDTVKKYRDMHQAVHS